jgi:hypothetical protein
MPDQVSQEHHRAIQECDDDQFASGEITFDLPRQLTHATGQLGFGNKDRLNLATPPQGHG